MAGLHAVGAVAQDVLAFLLGEGTPADLLGNLRPRLRLEETAEAVGARLPGGGRDQAVPSLAQRDLDGSGLRLTSERGNLARQRLDLGVLDVHRHEVEGYPDWYPGTPLRCDDREVVWAQLDGAIDEVGRRPGQQYLTRLPA